MTTRKLNLIVTLIASLVFTLNAPVNAITFTWDGTGGNDSYFTGGNWFGGTAPTGSSGNADIGQFDNTATGAKIVNIGAAIITDQTHLVSGATGYTFNGTGALNGNFNINTTGTNTFNVDVNANNNFGWSGGGITNIDAHFNRADTITRNGNGTTINVRNGGELSFNRLRTNSGDTTVNVEAGGLVTNRFIFHLDTTANGIIDVSGTVSALNSSGSAHGIFMDRDNNRLIINDGGVVFGRLSMGDDGGAGSDSTVDMFPGATLALRQGANVNIDTLAEFYNMTQGAQGLDGQNFRYFDGSNFVKFDDMVGTDFFAITFDPDFNGTGIAHNVLTTLATAAIPEPSSVILLSLGVTGLAFCRHRRRR